MFEMLGNFSFGDYFKEQAITMCWRFLTDELGLPVDRLHVTVLNSDEEARQLWKKVAGLPDHKILQLDKKENFWAMGDSGPCGPCSEVFWDLGEHIPDPDERFLELWNLVFMQFFRNEGEKELHSLPSCSVDTGMGLERMASVLQGVPSNYHTDVFVPLLGEVASVLDARRSSTSRQSFSSALKEELDPSKNLFATGKEIQTLRIISDHLRATYALLNDGVFPSNVGRGYVLRRIIRRAIRHAQQLGVQGTSDGILASVAVPGWTEHAGFQQMRAILLNEERAFEEMLRNGRGAIEKAFSKAQLTQTVLSGIDAFRLYDTYGIPLDITQVLAEEKGISVDIEGYDTYMKKHKQQTSNRSNFAGHHTQPSKITEQSSSALTATLVCEFVGYNQLTVPDSRVLDSWLLPSKTKGASDKFSVILDRCPFYPEGGGQVGDRGYLVIASVNGSQRISITVENTAKTNDDAIALQCSLPKGMTYTDVSAVLFPADGQEATVEAVVDRKFRAGCAVHHTATHLLQRALKAELGEHVTQAGSQVTNDRLRFDFAHFGALSIDEMARVEARVNEFAAAEFDVTTVQLRREEAERSGAICNFGDKYGDIVRVVRVGGSNDAETEPPVSSEFCGGTHVDNSREVFPFALVSEGSVAAGTRRIEAVAGRAGARYLQAKAQALSDVADLLSTTPAKVEERITKMQKQMKQLECRAQTLGDVVATLPSAPLASGCIDGAISAPLVELHALDLPGGSEFSKVLKRRAEFLAEQGTPDSVLIVMLGSQVACIVNTEAKVHAGKLLQQVVKPLGGRGGGSASFAQGSVPTDITPHEFARRSTVATQLRAAVRDLRVRGLKQATQFAAELLLGMGDAARRSPSHDPRRSGEVEDEPEDWADADRFEAAKACFDVGEYLRAHHILARSDASTVVGSEGVDEGRVPLQKSRFLKYYALYLVQKDHADSVAAGGIRFTIEVDRNLHRQGTNPHLKELYLALSAAYQQNTLDGFGLYLYAVVLKRLGYSTSTGSTQVQSSTPVSMKTRHRADFAEEQKRQQLQAPGTSSNNQHCSKNESTTLTFDVTTRFILVESIRRYPWNWSAWMELAAHSPFTSNEEEVILATSCPWMFQLFQAHVLLDQQQNDAARALLTCLEEQFPQSTYLLAQQALTSYHIRDFDKSQEQFERLAAQDPHRMENMEVYSNVLYVKEDKTELSRLAHRALKVEKYRPETCCIIGNYYSIKNKHDRAIIYFHRALKLDPNFLSAWTLIGHEYIEMKNTSAAIEAYRHAVDLNARDYRAWYGLGQAYEILNMFLYSIYYYRKAVAIRPYDARMWCALGGCYEKLNKVDEALACFHRAVNNQDREGIASYHLGRLYAARGQQHEAAKYYQMHLGLRSAPTSLLRDQDDVKDSMAIVSGQSNQEEREVLVLPGGSGGNIRVDTPQALAGILFLANYYKQLGRFTEAAIFCNRLLDMQGPEKEEAKALLREMHSLEATRTQFATMPGT
ncbi:unnamed protein product [Phytophthora fragariaefolia]|uniref:Alanine--tRNA ligase n=1 Tax=Phytophthora fragariaefolia TaxID=1490495 RepID=A0A9W6XNX7_9STRA|nr:unnamed protein product [Phytophthora fragariaefolia]